MRVFIAVLVLIFSLQSWVKAEDISEFEIEGMSIGDSLLSHTSTIGVTKDTILNKKFYFYEGSKRLALLAFSDKGNFNTYYKIQATVNPKNYKINRIGGFIEISDKSDCIDKQKKIINELENFFSNFEKFIDDKFSAHPADKTGKSVANGIYLDLPSGDSAMVECYLWSDEYRKAKGGHENNLRVTLSNKNANDFIANEAYK